MWDLIWTVPTSLKGLVALLQYFQERGGILAVLPDEWAEVIEWNVGCAVATLAGLPEPPMSATAELYGDEEGEDEESANDAESTD